MGHAGQDRGGHAETWPTAYPRGPTSNRAACPQTWTGLSEAPEAVPGGREADRFRASIPGQGGALRAPRGAVSDAAASARAGRAASGRSPRGARLRVSP